MVNEAIQPITLTKLQAFALCKDLLHGFRSAEFQMQMKALLGAQKGVRGHLQGRSELAFTVQSKVLPRHGIPGTEAGVNMMYDIIYPFLDDPMMHQMVLFIEDNLGMNAETSMGMLQSLFRSDTRSDSKRLTKADVELICQEVIQGLRHPEFKKSLQQLHADDVRGRLKLALIVQSTVMSAHGIQGVDNLFYWRPEVMTELGIQAVDLPDDEERVLLQTFAKILGRRHLVNEFVTVSSSLTKGEVVSITKDLMEGFCSLDFLQALRKLGADDAAGREKLAFAVQQRVLPKYGIPGTPGGVQYMLQAIGRHVDDIMLVLEDHALLHVSQEIENNLKTEERKLHCLLDSKPSTVADAKPTLTKDEAFQMVWQLLEGYSSADFQSQLLTLARNKSNTKSNLHSMRPTRHCPRHVPGRSKLALTVQRQVFPRFGLPGTFDGEKAMREAISPFKDDWMLQEMLWATEVQLGKNNETVLEWLIGRRTSPSAVQVNLTQIQIFTIIKELAEGFSSFEFQMQLQDYLRVGAIAHDMPGRMELALEVFSKVLPKYGLPGTYEGVAIMLEAMLPYMAEEEIEQLHASFLGAISPFMHDWMMLMDVVVLQDMLRMIDHKMDEIKEVETEDVFVDNFDCLDHGSIGNPEFEKKMADSWGRQVSGNSEASTACPFDLGDSFSRQVTGNSEASPRCRFAPPDSFSRQVTGNGKLEACPDHTAPSDVSTASPRDLELVELMSTLDVY